MWTPWEDSRNMEDIELEVHFSTNTEQLGGPKEENPVELIIKALERVSRQTLLLPINTEVGVWPKPVLDSRYSSFRVVAQHL